MLSSFLPVWGRIPAAAVTAILLSWLLTPPVRRFAQAVGAIDMPGQRRIHDHPIPRLGGVAVITAFLAAALLFADLTEPITGILLGTLVVAGMGLLDDIFNLNPWIKLLGQIAAAAIAVAFGVVLNGITNPFQDMTYGFTLLLGSNVSIVLTVFWIVMCTNAVNLIDGVDGLATGIAGISAATMMVVSYLVSDANVTVLLACLLGACIGFFPFNRNPARIFLGDVGSQTLGFILATASTLGLFKLHALITFMIPIMALAVPLADTVFAVVRRMAKGQSPFHADKGHFHHRLLALGLNQKQVCAILYAVTGVMGLISILMTESGAALKIVCAALAFLIAFGVWYRLGNREPEKKQEYSASEPDVKIYSRGDKK